MLPISKIQMSTVLKQHNRKIAWHFSKLILCYGKSGQLLVKRWRVAQNSDKIGSIWVYFTTWLHRIFILVILDGSSWATLINGVNISINFEQNKDILKLLLANNHYKITIELTSLYVKKVNVAPSIILVHEKVLEKGVFKMPIRRIDVNTFALLNGLQRLLLMLLLVSYIHVSILFLCQIACT